MSNNSIASLGGGLIGAGIGSFIPGGTAIGFSIGAAIGSALVPPQLADQVGPRLDDLTVTSSAYGQPIPLLWGSNRVSGKLIFSSGKKEKKHEEDLGGKGGPEQTAVSYTYSMDCAYSLGVLPPSATSMEVRKVWINSQLVYDVSETANAISLIKSTKMAAAVTVYDGSETQLPSSLQESYKGAGNVPAYRGMGLIEFEDLQLGQFGNGAINVSCEVVVAGSAPTVPAIVNAWTGPDSTDSVGYDNGTVWFADTEPDKAGGAWDGNDYYHILTQFDLEGNKLSENRTFIDSGLYLGARFGSNDPFLSHYKAPAGFFHARPLSATLIKNDESPKNPFNTTIDNPWGDYDDRWHWVKYGDYYYVSGGDYNAPSSQQPSFIGRYPIITDPSSAYFGYPLPDPDIAVNLGKVGDGLDFGQINPEMTVDYKLGRIYRIAQNNSTGDDTITSWDTELNLIARWDEGTAPSMPDVLRLPFFSGSNMVRTRTLAAQNEIDQYDFDPDVSQSTFTLLGTASGSAGNGAFPLYPLSETLCLARNDVVSTEPVVSQQNVTLATIFGDMLALTGASPSDYDVSALTDTVKGYKAEDLLSARRSLEPLMAAYFIDKAEVDNKIVFTKRGGASAKTIPDDDLISVDQAVLTVTRGSELELPKRVTFSYVNQAADYQNNQQHADRLVVVGSVGISNVSIPAVIDDDVAAQIADSMLYSTWIERDSIVAYVSTKYFELVPTDVITLGDEALRVRITNVDTKLIGAIKLTGVVDYAASYVSTRTGGASTAISTISGLPGPTITNLLDIPILRDVDAGIIKYLSTSGTLDGWGGALLYRSTDSGVNYTERATSVVNATYGFSTDVLSDGDTSTWDSVNTVNIGLASGTLTTESELSVLNGANAAAFGKHGRWEIIQFQTATLEGDGTYTLSDLLRGRRGTEHNTDNHVIGDSFVFLNEASLTRINDAAADIDSSYLYKGVTIGNTIQDTLPFAFTSAGVSITPFSPAYIQGTRDGSNNLTVTFKRRDYMGYTAKYTIPMSEDTESYELEFWDSTGVTQYGGTKTAATQTYSYTAASQTTDGATPGQDFLVKIYQISAIVDRGYEGSEII